MFYSSPSRVEGHQQEDARARDRKNQREEGGAPWKRKGELFFSYLSHGERSGPKGEILFWSVKSSVTSKRRPERAAARTKERKGGAPCIWGRVRDSVWGGRCSWRGEIRFYSSPSRVERNQREEAPARRRENQGEKGGAPWKRKTELFIPRALCAI